MQEFVVAADELFQAYTDRHAGQTGAMAIHEVLGIDKVSSFDGSFRLWQLNSGCLVALLDFEALEDFTTLALVKNFYSVEITLRGNSEVCMGSTSLSNDGVPRIYITSHGMDSAKKRIHRKGDKLRSIGMWISPRLFLESFGVDVSSLPDDIQNVLMTPDSGVVSLPLPAKILEISDQIFEMPYEGIRAEQYLKAKFTELLCLLAELAGTSASEVVEHIPLSRRKSDILKKTMLALEQSQYLSLSLGELADELGLCQSTLSTVFKEGYGMKLSEYLLQRRMGQAVKLLRGGSLSVLEVALEVGYDNRVGSSTRPTMDHCAEHIDQLVDVGGIEHTAPGYRLLSRPPSSSRPEESPEGLRGSMGIRGRPLPTQRSLQMIQVSPWH